MYKSDRIRAGSTFFGHTDVGTTMAYTHVLNREGWGSP